MSSYFNLSSYARAKKNKDDLEKTNPQEPVLKDDDEKFLEKHMSQDNAVENAKSAEPTKITEDGEEKPATDEEKQAASEGDQVVPETQPEPPVSPATKEKRKKDNRFELPSQEEAEAATRSWNNQVKLDDKGNASGEKKTWASYLPSMKPSPGKKPEDSEQKTEGQGDQRTWTQYASSYVPSSYPSLPNWARPRDKDSQPEPVYNEDGTINEEKTKEKQEKEVSVLLDNLNMSAINNRVFAFSAETQKFYERFAQVLKDTMNGVPTAYEDMDKLMREAGPTLEKQFNSMPPFVQTLVKSLPSKLGTVVGPEILAAAAAEKPDDEMKRRMETASKGEKFVEASSKAADAKGGDANKKKRKIPGVKSLVSKQGAVAGILRNTVNFLTTRFPFLASTTNVVMSLAVFILMFVFWYCHKRGREIRLAKTAEGEAQEGEVKEVGEEEENDDDDDGDDIEVEYTDEEAGEEEAAAEEIAEGVAQDLQETLQQSQPAEVPLPGSSQGKEAA
ncbi:hypothetical protein M409DRAFT_24133 [Zasmidium cellare ATCC 36951]|uniref:Uncharacterized protein n=1 Tax=Zasmidium cellare ATCC 36951 TaxID=1080233 RepID=A0A6A6CF37_ZASCE|nr:uncharacterized protein M409DRAFT_24133 [Zasmidium cellare ATCC 36951]KAF2165847.1 hypothetical protein M409DRAFT_24133 [Zasmidium cellare ATCC 36951]